MRLTKIIFLTFVFIGLVSCAQKSTKSDSHSHSHSHSTAQNEKSDCKDGECDRHHKEGCGSGGCEEGECPMHKKQACKNKDCKCEGCANGCEGECELKKDSKKKKTS